MQTSVTLINFTAEMTWQSNNWNTNTAEQTDHDDDNNDKNYYS